MAKHLTPIVGLAVVVALALAAVFGSMSLANPAMAAIGQPADAELTERTDSPQQAAAPTGLEIASVGTQTVTISLDFDSDFPVAANYQVRFRENSANSPFNAWVNGAGTGVTFTAGTATTDVMIAIANDASRPLNNDQEYEFQVQTFNTTSNSAGMAASIMATPQAPPGGTIADDTSTIPDESRGRIEIKWTYTPTDGTNPVGDWEYTLDTTASEVEWESTGLSGNGPHTYTITGVEDTSTSEPPAGTAYANLGLRAVAVPVNADQPGAESAQIATSGFTSVTVFNATPLEMPTGVDATGGDEQITVTWTLVENARSYKVTAKASGQDDKSLTVHGDSATITGLANNVTYDIEVVAEPAESDLVNADSAAARTSARTEPGPDLPTVPSLAATPGDGQLMVTWGRLGSRALLNVERLEYAVTATPAMGDAMFQDSDWNVLDKAATSVTIDSLMNDTEYTVGVRVVAIDSTDDNALDNPVGDAVTTTGTPERVAISELMPMASGVAGNQMITVSWYDLNDDRIDGWRVRYKQSSATTDGTWTSLDAADRSHVISGLTNGTAYTVELQGLEGTTPTMSWTGEFTPLAPAGPFANTFEADDLEPGKNSWYTLEFEIDRVFNGGADTMIIKLEEFGVPSTISTSGIAIVATEPASSSGFDQDPENKGYNNREEITFNPASVAVDGKEITLTFPDVRPEGDITKKSFDAMTQFKVILYQSAGISNPTRSKVYGGATPHEDREIFVNFNGVNVPSKILLGSKPDGKAGLLVPRLVQLSEEDGGLGDSVEATALGFENGGTLHFFLDKFNDKNGNGMLDSGEDGPNGVLDSGEDVLCSVPSVSSNLGSCSFTVSTPTFSSGFNYVNAVDGDGMEVENAYDPDDVTGLDNDFELKASIKATPAGGSPGEIMQVQLVSFTNNAVTAVKLSGDYICGNPLPDRRGSESCSSELGNVGIGSQGTASISVPVPNWAVAGVQELVVVAGDEDDDVKVTIVGPRIVSTPQTVVANQRVSLVGTGFSPDSVIGRAIPGQTQIARISIGGDDIAWSRVNNNRVVEVDDGGNWSASVDLPLSDATTGEGIRKIRITDSMGRTGSVDVNLAERDFDITPPEGRVGTIAVVRGHGYPSKNDEGTSFTVDVVYNVQEGTSTRVSVVPDASGRFEVQLRIPTTAPIPSTNQVEVKFELADGTEVLENKQHIVPEGIINLSDTSGGPGSTITVSGEGYKAFVNVDSVKIGTFDVTPSPKPHTNGNGMMSFSILIPGIDVGIQTIEVQVGGTTSSTGFTVTESGINPGDIVEVAKGIEDLGDNLVSVWNFNNDTKVWSFYDPTLAEGNTLTHMISGETYLIRIKTDAEVILNRDTRNLTCVGGNCWNQIVW